MRLPSTDRGAIDRLKNHFISKMIPGVGTWGEIDALRGWKDDFMGKALHPQYTAVSAGAGSGGALQNNAHGGVYRLTAGAAINAEHILWLGDAADGYRTLDADLGWVMMARMTISHLTNIGVYQGARGAVGGDSFVLAGIHTALVANNWLVFTINLGVGLVVVDTGVAADTNPHWHVLDVYPITGGLRQVDYFLDGTLIGTTAANVPTPALTPRVSAYTPAAAARYVDLDYWGVIPRNLA